MNDEPLSVIANDPPVWGRNKMLYFYVAHLGTMALVRRIAWRIMILGSWSSIGGSGG